MLHTLMDPGVSIWLAGGFFVLGYLIIHQVTLRCMFLFGTGFYVLYYATAAEAPLWGAIYTSSIMGAANVVGLGLLFARQSAWAIPAAHRDLYPVFSHLPPGDFRALMRLGHRYVTTSEEVLGQEGQAVDRLTYIISGSARVEKRGEQFTLPPGLFIGEVALLLNRPSAATTVLPPGSEIVSWDRRALEARSRRSPRFKLALEAAISVDMASKVAMAVAPEAMRGPSVAAFDSRAAAQ